MITLFHMSPEAFDSFETRYAHAFGSHARHQPIFFKNTLEEAKSMMNAGRYLYTCLVDLGKHFDPTEMYAQDAKYTHDPDSLTPLGRKVWRELFGGTEEAFEAVFYMMTGAYDIMESAETLDWLQKNDYDSFLVSEVGNLSRDISIAIFDPSKIEILHRTEI
jgi:hypothetical protein